MIHHLLIFWQRKLENAYHENHRLQEENKRLQAEVERLTKTGDAMAMTLYDMVNRKKPTYASDLLDLAMQWKSAAKKKGGQS